MKTNFLHFIFPLCILMCVNVNNVNSQVLNEGFEGSTFPPNGWTKTVTDPTVAYQWKHDSTNSHNGSYCASVHYDPYLIQQNEWLISPTLNLTSLTTPTLDFWWKMSYYYSVNPYNYYDFKVNVSTDGGTTWAVIWTEDSAGVFGENNYNHTSINLSAYATSTNYKVAFQYVGSDGDYLYLDDITVGNLPNNRIEFTDIWDGFVRTEPPYQYSGYTQIPSGEIFPVSFAAEISNTGALPQTNVSLKAKNLTTGTLGTTLNILQFPAGFNDTLEVDNIDTLGNTIGTFNYALYAISDSIASIPYKDTITVTVNDKTNGMYSRDNNYYDGTSTWNGMSAAPSCANAFQMANLVEITTNDPIYAKSISVVIASGTTINAPIKAILYQGWNKVDIAESDYHFIQANEIVTTTGSNPYSIEMTFNNYSNSMLQKDTVYFAAVQAFGGTDTVWLAVGTNKIPQPDYTMYIYDTDNMWYYFVKGTAPAMIRLNTTSTALTLLPYPAGTITGLTTVCQGQTNVTYTVPPISNATYYIWTLPNGTTDTTTINTITVNYDASAVSGEMSVKGNNVDGNGLSSYLYITVNSLPATPGTISGNTNVVPGQQNVAYSVPLIPNATSYVWTLPNGASGNDTTNNIVVNYSSSAISGYITVYAVNSCGIGASSSILVTVNPVVPNCSAQFEMVADSTPHSYNIVNNASGVPPLKYLWSWGDGTFDTTAYPNHTYSVGGYYNICLTITDAVGCTNTYCDSTLLQKSGNYIISVQVIPGITGINEIKLSDQIKIYPNPTKDNLTIETNSNTEQRLEIINLVGQTIYTSNINNKATVYTSAFASGVYFVKLYTDKETVVRKFVKE